jgi:uncharacterized membrane protein (UPF0127 family)
MQRSSPIPRFVGCPTEEVGGVRVPVAVGLHARLLGLAHLDLEQAGAGLLIPGCSSVHTFGMRFALELVFLDEGHQPLSIRRSVPPRRLAGHRGAAAVLELPPGGLLGWGVLAESGEFAAEGGERDGASPE